MSSATYSRAPVVSAGIATSSGVNTTSATLVSTLASNEYAEVQVYVDNVTTGGTAVTLLVGGGILYTIPASSSGITAYLGDVRIGPGQALTLTSTGTNTGAIRATGVKFVNG